jgi:hypothetical protein
MGCCCDCGMSLYAVVRCGALWGVIGRCGSHYALGRREAFGGRSTLWYPVGHCGALWGVVGASLWRRFRVWRGRGAMFKYTRPVEE